MSAAASHTRRAQLQSCAHAQTPVPRPPSLLYTRPHRCNFQQLRTAASGRQCYRLHNQPGLVLHHNSRLNHCRHPGLCPAYLSHFIHGKSRRAVHLTLLRQGEVHSLTSASPSLSLLLFPVWQPFPFITAAPVCLTAYSTNASPHNLEHDYLEAAMVWLLCSLQEHPIAIAKAQTGPKLECHTWSALMQEQLVCKGQALNNF